MRPFHLSHMTENEQHYDIDVYVFLSLCRAAESRRGVQLAR